MLGLITMKGLMMAKHIHADLMLQYAQDAMETDKPWERWEVSGEVTGTWISLSERFSFMAKHQYRRKPKMLSVTLVSGEVVSWPEPHRTELEYGDPYFYFTPTHGDIVLKKWDRAPWDISTLSNGYIHLTKEAAEQHAAALLKINTQGRDNG